MIQITMRNGVYVCWKRDQYTDYIYDGKIFAIMKDERLIGIYNIDAIKEIRIDI